MNNQKGGSFKKAVLATSIATALSLGAAQNAFADIYRFTFSNSGCVPGGAESTCTDTTTPAGLAGGYFTLATSSGAPVANTAKPYYDDLTWGYGYRTQIQGSLTIDTATGKGLASISAFDFQGGTHAKAPANVPAEAKGMSMFSIGDGLGGAGNLWLGNMLFDWNVTIGIPVSIVWDMSGLTAGLALLDVNNIGAAQNTIDAVDCDTGGALVSDCVAPATNGIKSGKFSIGPVPVATTNFNTTDITGAALLTNPSGEEPINLSDIVAGNPMITAPFANFGATFDFSSLVLSEYNDTSPPTLTMPVKAVTVALGGTFDPLNPGVVITCLDTADGSDDIVDAVTNNTQVDFVITGDTVLPGTENTYNVTYTCNDHAGDRTGTAVPDDPNKLDPTSAVVVASTAANNNSNSETLVVTVSDVDRPVISVTNVAHEACDPYTDSGVTATDLQDDDAALTLDIAPSGAGYAIEGTNPAEGVYIIDYDVTDSGTGNPGAVPLAAGTQSRTVTVTDNTAPVLTLADGNTVALQSTNPGNYALPDANFTDCNPATGTVSPEDTLDFILTSGTDSVERIIRYIATDDSTDGVNGSAGNSTQINLIATIYRAEPVITINGSDAILDVDDVYTELGIDIHDVQDGDLSDITTSGTTPGTTAGMGNIAHTVIIKDGAGTVVDSVDTSVNGGRYTITYDATDSETNVASDFANQVVRNVSVGVYADGSNFTMFTPLGQPFGGTNDVVFDWDETFNTDESDTDFSKMKIKSASNHPFFASPWTAKNIRVFNTPGTYTFDTTCTLAQVESNADCSGNALPLGQTVRNLTMTIEAGEIGAHMLFDWGDAVTTTSCGVGNCNIDVVNVWKENDLWLDPDGAATVVNNLYLGEAGDGPNAANPFKLVSTDVNGDGINGAPMVDGPFIGYYANFNAGPSGEAVEPPVYKEKAPKTSLGNGSIGSMSVGVLFTGLVSLLGFALRRKLKQKA